MSIYNLTDVELQDTLVNFLSEQANRRQSVRDQKNKLQTGLRNNLASDTQVLSMLNDYRANVEQAKEDYKKALAVLDTKIGYSKNPRLEATLVLLGVIGDESSFIIGPMGLGIYSDTTYNKPAVATPAPR